MSSIRLLKDEPNRGLRGDIISVPFGVGQRMIADGVGEYPQAAPVAPAAPAVAATSLADRHADEIKRLNALHAEAIKDVKEEATAQMRKMAKDHDATTAKLQADLDAANKTIAELNAKAKK